MSEKLRDAVSARIRALLSKTTENGATEAEAMAAAAKARELMDRYRLSLSDVEVQAEPLSTIDIERSKERRVAAVDYCMSGIEAYCGVKMWYRSKNGVRYARTLGLKSDVEMAHYLYTMIDGAITVETRKFQKTNEWHNSYNRRTATSGFQVGMAARINIRLKAMAKELEPIAKTASGTALVVVKNAVVQQAYDSLGLKFRGSMHGMSIGSNSAYQAGQDAGNRVNLSRPVTSNNTPKLH